MIDKLRLLRADYLKAQHDLSFYPYQNKVSDAIIQALLDNLRITAGASEEEVKRLRQIEIAIEQSRQSGKTYGIAYTCEFILTFLPTMFNRPIRIGIFAAQVKQADISYTILRSALRKAKSTILSSSYDDGGDSIPEKDNATRLVLPDGSSVTIAPINKLSLIEGMSLDLIIIDEAQLVNDEIVKHSIWPMGASTNAPRVYIGKAGTQICYFYRLSQKGDSIKVYFEDIVKQRRELYNQTKDARHLIYEVNVRSNIEQQGLESDEIQREYFGKWQIGTGQFVTQEALEALVDKGRKPTFHFKKGPCFAGIDTGKHPDSTVVTILRDMNEVIERTLPDGTKTYGRKRELLNWMELRGENYQNQFDVICSFLAQYNVIALAIDSTGQGDFMPDMFENNTEWQDENSGLYRVKFSATSKDILYKNLKVSIQQQLLRVPELNTKLGIRFREQMLDLQQEYKGQLLSCHHPDVPEGRDDFADSVALADFAAAKWYADAEPQLVVVTGNPERKTEKNEEGETTDYWPGQDWD